MALRRVEVAAVEAVYGVWMRRGIPLTAFVVALVAMFSWGAALAERSFVRVLHAPSIAHEMELPAFDEAERPELQVLLSSIDMTVSLIDAYGRCRDDEKTHGQCMAIIRNTLAHARTMIGQ